MTKKLSYKQRMFVEAYLTTWKPTEAARQAGYANPDRQGYRLLRYVEIQEAIEQRLKEKAMGADEVLARLAEQARVNIGDFISEATIPVIDANGELIKELAAVNLNWDEIKKRGYLVKKITSTQNGPAIELVDNQTALIQIGKHLKLFTENIDMTSAGKPLEVVQIVEVIKPETDGE